MPSAPDPVVDIDGATFRSVVGHLASGVTVITCEVQGRSYGMTASSVTSLSADPPMMLVCVNRSAPTAAAIRAAGGFVVNVLRAGQEHVARQFARPSENKFEGMATAYGALSMPVLREALAHLECEVREHVDAGTHTIFLGRVVDAVASSDGEPLAYFRGSFGRLHPALEGAASDSRATQKAVSARGVLEAGVIAVALAGVGDRELHTVAQEFARMDELHSEDVLVDVDDFFSANADFHRAIVGLASNPAITSAFDRLELGPLLVRTQAGQARCASQLIEVQRDLVNALLDRDVEAATEYVLAYAAMAVDRTRQLSGATRH